MNIYERISAGLFALVAFLSISLTVVAQEDSVSDTSKIHKLNEIIVSASRYEQSPNSVGRNITVITEQEIQNSIYNNVSELLGQQQSIHMVGANQTPGSLQSTFIRNTNSNHSIVMIDGIRISDPSGSDNGINLAELSLSGIKRIEIVRGSHSTLYGSSAIGGVVNIITKKGGRQGFSAGVSTEHGVFGDQAYSTNNSVSVNYTDDSGLYTNISADQRYTKGTDATVDTSAAGGFNPQDKDGFRKLDLYGKLGYSRNGFDIYGSYRRADQRAELDQGAFEDDDNAKQNFDRDLFTYGISQELSGRFALDFEGGYSSLNRDFVNDSSVVDAQGNYDNTFTETTGDGTLWENSLSGIYDAENMKLILGFENSRQTMNSQSYTFISSFNYESETNLDSLDLKEKIKSAFLHTDLNGALLAESLDAFSLVLGARYSDHNNYGSHITYEINPRYQLTSSSMIYGAISTGFNAPSLYQLHTPQKGFGAHTTRGNSGLQPEESVSYELGWKQNVGKDIRFDISLFQTDVENVIEYVYLWNGDKTVSNLTGVDYKGDTYINIAEQHIKGVELGVNVQAISNFSITGNLSYTESESVFAPRDIDESYTGGNHVQIFESGVFVNNEKKVQGLTRRPSISANVQIDYLPTADWKIGLSSQFVGERDDIFYSSALGPYGALDRSEVSNYNITDLSVRYRLNSNISLIGKVKNILDTDYQEIRGYTSRGRGFYLKATLSL